MEALLVRPISRVPPADPGAETAPAGTLREQNPGSAGCAGAVDFVGGYTQEFPGLVWFLMSLGASAHEAADVAQTAFTEAFPAWSIIRCPRAWLRPGRKPDLLPPAKQGGNTRGKPARPPGTAVGCGGDGAARRGAYRAGRPGQPAAEAARGDGLAHRWIRLGRDRSDAAHRSGRGQAEPRQGPEKPQEKLGISGAPQ